MYNSDKIKAMEELLSKFSEEDIAELLQEDKPKVGKWEEPVAIPFRCPICLQECWKAQEVEKSELDASNPYVRPYSAMPISSVWTFACGHSVERVSDIIAPVEREEEDEEELA